jgi:hypothetical protein
MNWNKKINGRDHTNRLILGSGWRVSIEKVKILTAVLASLAHLVEHLTCNEKVIGSNPIRGSKRCCLT